MIKNESLRRIKLFALTALCPFILAAQDGEPGNWLMYFGKHQLSDKLSLHSELQYRSRSAAADDVEQILSRVGINWQLSQSTMLTAGYGFIPNYDNPGEIANALSKEHRIWQQMILVQRDRRMKFEHRYRFEQRFVGDDFRLRLRYRLMATYPLNNTDFIKGTWFLGMYDEIFMNTERTFFDRNRFYGAAGYVINKELSVQAGVLHQEVENSGGKFYMQFAVFLNGDFRRKGD